MNCVYHGNKAMTAYSGQNKLSVMEFKKPFGPSLSVPNSRTNLW